jgi:hypothetical protein
MIAILKVARGIVIVRFLIHWLSMRCDRRLNHAIHTAAVTRLPTSTSPEPPVKVPPASLAVYVTGPAGPHLHICGQLVSTTAAGHFKVFANFTKVEVL